MRLPLVVVSFGIACLASGQAYCGGFQIRDQGGAVAGQAYAGAAAIAEDASTVFYNPAGMSFLSRSEMTTSADVLFPRGKLKNEGSFDITGIPLSGGSSGMPDAALVPSFYAVWVPDHSADWLRLGFAINAPFGLATEYGQYWVGRYTAIHSEVKTYNFNPSVSIKVFDWLSVGAGFNAQWMDARLSNAIDFGGICTAVLGPLFCPFLHLAPQQADGRVRLTADDWGFGYNGGVMLSPTATTRIGVAYRSHMDFDLDGEARFNVPAQAALLTAGGTVFQNGGIKARLSEPETVTFGLYQKFAPKWVGLFGAEWTRWSRVQELRVQFDNPLQPDSVLPADWQDTWFFSAGVNYLYSDRLTLRAGVAYDESPIPTSTRTPRLPGSDAVDLAVGAGYKLHDDIQIDIAYQLGLLDQADIALSDPIAGTLNGYYDFTTHVFSLQVSRQF